jgi:CheY-like chemotaxis protein
MWPVVAESGPAALKLLESVVHPIPLVLTDAHMPEMDGFELLKQIKIHSGIPTVIMLTSGSYAGDVVRSRELGAEAYLVKPVRRDELMQTILRVLTEHPPLSQPLAGRTDIVHPRPKQPGLEALGRIHGLHVLVAEDNLINQRYALSVLEKDGYSAVVVSNGREALAAMERESFDLVLMDVHMPEMDGFEATSAIRARERFLGTRVPIIAVTAHAMSGDREKCLAAGMDAYVSKPIRRAELIETIAALLNRGKMPSTAGPTGSASRLLPSQEVVAADR